MSRVPSASQVVGLSMFLEGGVLAAADLERLAGYFVDADY